MAVGDNVLCTCKRKEMRKNKKKIKKAQRMAYFSHKKVEEIISKKEGLQSDLMKMPSESGNELESSKKKKKKRKKKSSKIKEQLRKEELLRAIEEDDIEIHRYEKILGYKKRKSKNLPQVFRAEGLDYVLEVCDAKKFKPNLDEEESDLEIDAGEDNELEMLNEEGSDKSEQSYSKSNFSASTKGSSTYKKNDRSTGTGEDSKNFNGDDDDDDNDNGDDDDDDDDGSVKEDIYGRLINKKTGEIVPSNMGAKEKLDELERKAGLLETEEHIKLKKSIRGLVNRLNENTLVAAVKSFSDIFSTNGHNEVKQLLFSEILNSIDVGYRLPDRLITEYAVFIALIHSTVSSEVSSFFIENYITKLLETIASPPEGKSLENFSVILAELYNFKVIKVIIITDIMEKLRNEMTDKCLTCFKTLLSHCGNTMKKRDLDAFQKCITETQSFFAQLPESASKKQQLRYTIDEINEIKNLNVRKFTDTVDSTLHDHYLKIFRGLTRKVDKETELPMSVDDILHISDRGRWWLVGSAWLPSASGIQDKSNETSVEESSKFDASLLLLAKKAKMNTAVRRDIFCTIMSSTDEMNAFERLLKLSLKGQQEREIVHICVHCSLRETSYNPFYAAVIDHLCCFHKRFKLTTQYALWDRIRDLSKMTKLQRRNLAYIIIDLMVKRSVGITLLKVIEFAAIDKITTEFVRRILSAILTQCTQQTLMDIFRKVITSSEHKLFAEGLQLFIHMALKKPQKNIDNKLLMSRIDFLDSIWGDDRL